MDNIIHIFIGAPNDVNPERKIIKEVINNMNKVYRNTGLPIFDLIEVEKDVKSDIGSGLDAQGVIDENIGDYDLFIGILWKKFGTPTKTHESGTQQEFEKALENHKDIMFYFSNLPVAPNEIDSEQFKKVSKFKNNIKSEGLYCEYDSLDEFKKLIEDNLRIFATKKRGKESHSTKKNEKEEENKKAILELYSSTFDNFTEGNNDSKKLSALFDSCKEKIDEINPPREDDINSYKKYSNSVAELLNNLSDELKNEKNKLITHYSTGTNNLIELLEVYGSYMGDNSHRQKMKKEIDELIEVLNDTIKEMDEIIEIFDKIPPMTTKLIRAKSKFIKNIKELQKDFKNLRRLFYNALSTLNDSSKC